MHGHAKNAERMGISQKTEPHLEFSAQYGFRDKLV